MKFNQYIPNNIFKFRDELAIMERKPDNTWIPKQDLGNDTDCSTEW